jgi:CDP-glycerol glycerophosphotransferase (TagB/SpsB family)
MEMYSVSDFVISDYSSIIYEAGIMNKHLIFYAFDLDNYKDSRDFFIDYDKELPGPIVKNGKELKTFLGNPDYSKYKNRNMISKYVDLTIDNYSKNMVNEIKKVLYENEKN